MSPFPRHVLMFERPWFRNPFDVRWFVCACRKTSIARQGVVPTLGPAPVSVLRQADHSLGCSCRLLTLFFLYLNSNDITTLFVIRGVQGREHSVTVRFIYSITVWAGLCTGRRLGISAVRSLAMWWLNEAHRQLYLWRYLTVRSGVWLQTARSKKTGKSSQ